MRSQPGEKNGRAKLNIEQVNVINGLRVYGFTEVETQSAIKGEYDIIISTSEIGCIYRQEAWSQR